MADVCSPQTMTMHMALMALVVLLMASAATGYQDHAQDACVLAPDAPECAFFEYPAASAAADLSRLCGAMHFMPACSVAKACNASGAGPASITASGAAAVRLEVADDICQPFNLLATVCRLDSEMSRMAGACTCCHPAGCCKDFCACLYGNEI